MLKPCNPVAGLTTQACGILHRSNTQFFFSFFFYCFSIAVWCRSSRNSCHVGFWTVLKYRLFLTALGLLCDVAHHTTPVIWASEQFKYTFFFYCFGIAVRCHPSHKSCHVGFWTVQIHIVFHFGIAVCSHLNKYVFSKNCNARCMSRLSTCI